MTRPRRAPYTTRGIRRRPCFRCGSPARYQWQICADNNVYRTICAECDIRLNALVLKFMRDPQRREKLSAYREMVGGEEK